MIYTIDAVSLQLTEYQSDILQLFQNIQTFEYPTNHNDFYHDHFEDEGKKF